MALISGSFNAKTAGNYNWEIPGNDDRGAFWIDLDRNGIFELDGQQGVEKILDASGDFVSKTVNLSPNLYQIALIHGESTGESSQKLMFSAPSSNSGQAGPTILTTVKPSDPIQHDLFVTENEYSLLKRGRVWFYFRWELYSQLSTFQLFIGQPSVFQLLYQ